LWTSAARASLRRFGSLKSPRMTKAYRRKLAAVLTPRERRQFDRLDTPQKIQDFLDALPANFEPDGDTHMSPRRLLKARVAHCTEGAIFAAACLAYHGHDAPLMDLRSLPADQDHVVTLFKQRGLWGAISKTNHAVLRWRDPIYRSPRELAMSYAHEYYLKNGRKSLVAFSRPFGLTRYAPARWVIAEDNLDWLIIALDDSPHVALAPRAVLRRQRRATAFERKVTDQPEWRAPRHKSRKRLS
jgi:hypothetical protein